MRWNTNAGVLILSSIVLAIFTPSRTVARPLHGTFSGAFSETNVDPDDEGPADAFDYSHYHGTGSLGNFGLEVRASLLEWDGKSFCSPTEVLVEYFAHQSVQRLANGDLIYRDLEDGTLCFDFLTSEFTFVINTKIVGGTGRFAGATGWTRFEGEGRRVGDLPGFGGVTSRFEGEVFR